MIKTAKIITFFILTFFSISCIAPSSKQSYLDNFERFVKDVEKNAQKFTAQDWRWSNKRFTKYSDEWYKKFENDLKMEEKIKVSILKARYLSAKQGSEIGRYLNDNLKHDLEKAGKDLQKYLEENLDKDIREISKGAHEIGDSAVKVMKDVLKEIKKDK
jgi:hypothetical protein